MKELDRIKENNSTTMPLGQKTIIKVSGIENPQVKIEILKNVMIGFLENQNLASDSEEWYQILPSKFISFLKNLTEEDILNDETLIINLHLIINDLKEKEWEWYSSKIVNNGFEIVFKDSFYPKYIFLIHYLNIPLSKIWIEDDRFGNYFVETIRDVTLLEKFKDF